jgi:hypothetical protein
MGQFFASLRIGLHGPIACDLLAVSGPISPPLLLGSGDSAFRLGANRHGRKQRYLGQDNSANDEFRRHLGFLSHAERTIT